MVDYSDLFIVPYHPKPFIFCLFKSISSDNISLLRSYGKVIQFGNQNKNLSIQSFEFDYFIIDFRIEEDRIYFKKYINPYRDHYYFILYRYFFETNNGLFFHNEMVDLPSYQITKEEFDMMLLETPISSPPNCMCSLYKYFCK